MKVSCTARAWSWLSCRRASVASACVIFGSWSEVPFDAASVSRLGLIEGIGLWTLEQGPERVCQLSHQIVWRHLEVRHGAPSERPSSPSMGTDLPLLLISSNMRSRKESDSCIEVQNQ